MTAQEIVARLQQEGWLETPKRLEKAQKLAERMRVRWAEVQDLLNAREA